MGFHGLKIELKKYSYAAAVLGVFYAQTVFCQKLPLVGYKDLADRDLIEIKLDISPMNPLAIRSALEFLPNQSVRLDARLEVQIMNNPDAIGVPNHSKATADFLQMFRKNAREKNQFLMEGGRTAVLKISALPLIVSNELSANDMKNMVSIIARDAAAAAAASIIRDEVSTIVPAEIHSDFTNGVFHVLDPVTEVLKGVVGDLTRKIVDHPIERNYGKALIRNTFIDSYFGAFKVFKAEKEAFIIYYTFGLKENIEESPLLDKMAVQAAHYLAGSGSGLTGTLGMKTTVGEGKTLGFEIDIFKYKPPFAQRYIALMNEIGTFSKKVFGETSSQLTLSYFDEPRNLDILLQGKLLEGEPAGDIRIRKGFGKKVNFYLDAAYSERNRKWKYPSILEDTVFEQMIPFFPDGSLIKGVGDALQTIPNRAGQEPGTTSYFSFLFAIDRLLYSGISGDFHYTFYVSKDHGFYDVIRNGIGKIDEKTTVASSFSWTRDMGETNWKAYASFGYSESKYTLLDSDSLSGEEKVKKGQFEFSLVGSIEFNQKRFTELAVRERADKKTALLLSNYYENIQFLFDQIMKLDLADQERFLLELNQDCSLYYLDKIYLYPDFYIVPEWGRAFRSFGEMRQNPKQVYELLKLDLPCS